MASAPDNEREFIDVGGRMLHVVRVGPECGGAPLVFLHEGLGSVELWRTFPDEIVRRSDRPALVYSRYGNGWSAPLSERRQPRYMHDEALQTLPQLLDAVLSEPPVLIGHSDGASIAVIYAGAGNAVRGLVLIAPHVLVEPETIASIASISDDFSGSDMAEKMYKYHQEPETTFRGWANIWLSPAFVSWNIEEYLAAIRCPTLLIQGDGDEYGTMRQLDAIERGLGSPAERLVVAGAGHSPHLSHPDLVADAVAGFIAGLG